MKKQLLHAMIPCVKMASLNVGLRHISMITTPTSLTLAPAISSPDGGMEGLSNQFNGGTMNQITLQITTEDLKSGLPDNYHDPVCLAMNRDHPEGAPWKCEIFSSGQLLKQGGVWNSTLNYDLDEQSTHALYAFDNHQPVAPFTAILTEIK